MKKIIKFKLDKNDEFFQNLKKTFLNQKEIGFEYQLKPVVEQIINAVFNTLKLETINQKADFLGDIKYVFEKKENSYPAFYFLMQENIDESLNRKTHTATLETILSMIVDFMVKTADMQAQAKEIKVSPLIDTNYELNAIIEHVTQTWDGFDRVNANEFFTELWNSCLHFTRYNINKYDLNFLKLVESWSEERSDYDNWVSAGSALKDSEFKICIFDDAIKNLSYEILIGRSNLTDALRKKSDYEENVKSLIGQAKTSFPQTTKLKPKGWKELAKNYNDYDGMNNFQEDQIFFKGTNTSGACSGSFPMRVSLPHVMYDDKCQGRKPLEVLMGAMLAHAHVISEKNNSSKMIQEWLNIKENYSQPQYYQDIIKTLDLNFKEPLNKALYALINDSSIEEALEILIDSEKNNTITRKKI